MLVLASGLVLALDPPWSPFHRQSALEALVAAVGQSSCCDARLAGVPSPRRAAVTRGTTPTGRGDWQLVAAAAQAEHEASVRIDPPRIHALGVARLLLLDHDGAVLALEQAVAASPTSARFRSDLSAAYLARAEAKNGSEDYFRAFALADRALTLDPVSAEAAFNRALALQRLPLPHAARQAYELYLSRDARSEWAAVARGHLSELAAARPPDWTESRSRLQAALDRQEGTTIARIVRAFPQASRELLEDEVLPEWGEAVLATAPAAPLLFERASRLASALSLARSDPFFQDVIAHLATLPTVPRTLAARALVLYRDGRRLQLQERSSDSAEPFLAATSGLERVASPFRLRAEVEFGYSKSLPGSDGSGSPGDRTGSRRSGRATL